MKLSAKNSMSMLYRSRNNDMYSLAFYKHFDWGKLPALSPEIPIQFSQSQQYNPPTYRQTSGPLSPCITAAFALAAATAAVIRNAAKSINPENYP